MELSFSPEITIMLTILIFACPLTWIGALAVWGWRRAVKRAGGPAPLVFCVAVVSHFAGFLFFHADPYWLLDGGARDFISPLGQALLGGAVGSLFACLILPVMLLFNAFARKREKNRHDMSGVADGKDTMHSRTALMKICMRLLFGVSLAVNGTLSLIIIAIHEEYRLGFMRMAMHTNIVLFLLWATVTCVGGRRHQIPALWRTGFLATLLLCVSLLAITLGWVSPMCNLLSIRVRI